MQLSSVLSSQLAQEGGSEQLPQGLREGTTTTITLPSPEDLDRSPAEQESTQPPLDVVVILDPLSKEAQQLSSVIPMLRRYDLYYSCVTDTMTYTTRVGLIL